MADCIKIERVLSRPGGPSDRRPVSPIVVFTDEDDLYSHRLDWLDWVDLGRPDTITVTVQPGDLLNDEIERLRRLAPHPELFE